MDPMIKVAAYIAAGFAMGVGTIGPALGQGRIGATACEMIGKYPENYGPIRFTLILAMGFVETSAVYALLIALILIFLT
ncbi:ATP synthase F0 subunit C [Candidatus Dependentiae bacterium]|nr:ATP synthase F0 subunit C [Candidatus Dependentiae bacterium]